MSAWRVIITDTESASGVGPVCEETERHAGYAALHDIEPTESGALPTGPLVFDCCPHPHIETWDENFADELAARMTEHGAEVCS